MKQVFLFLLFLYSLNLSAQEARTFGSSIYGDLHLGLMFTGEYASGSGGAALGYRLDDQHSLGIALLRFSEISVSTTRSASCIGLQYRYQLKRWAFDACTGYVHTFRYTGDDPYPTEVVQKHSNPWYYKLGVHRNIFGVLYLGLSYAQSGSFVLQHTDPEEVPPRIWSYKTLGVYAFTLNLTLLFQKRYN